MYSNLNIVMFGFNGWDDWIASGFCTRSAKLTKLLSRHPDVGKIVVVSTPKSIFSRAWYALGRKGAPQGRILKRGLWFSIRQVDRKIIVLDHFRLLPKETAADWFFNVNGFLHDRSLRRRLRKIAKDAGMKNYCLWLANPLMARHVGKMQEEVSVFDAIDDWRVHPQKIGIKKTLQHAYEEIGEKVDVILTVSKALREQFLRDRGNVFWLPNGVDTEYFSEPRAIPDELRRLTRPIIEYVGTLQERVDVDLLVRVSEAMPGASFVFIGPMVNSDHFDRLQEQNNVHFLGRIEHSRIPAFMQHADVCIVPHVQNQFTASMNPLKIYEYLAAGTPVVATEVEGLEEFRDVVYLATDADEFIALIAQALKDSSISNYKRGKFLDACHWTKRTEEALAIVNEFRSRSDLPGVHSSEARTASRAASGRGIN